MAGRRRAVPVHGPRHDKRRPALVLTVKAFNRHGHSVLAMITSASHQPWPGDAPIEDLKNAGLKTPSLVRLKLFTLDNRFIARRIGTLGSPDQTSVATQLRTFLPMLSG